MGDFYIGDMLYQLFSFGILALFIFLIVSLFKSSKERKRQLDRIEEKLDSLSRTNE
ncbi:DUF4083 domain-containing protein [Ornithinibacillus californiensis]|uniref:DUF4083 domain-containing protein n=1 Tax=Ornithinibacillus californiensis TaxID=161536 RepID=UPI0012EDFCC6|nr:DUF4083 domain-containing protein [Ornithinibacillus californiensis]